MMWRNHANGQAAFGFFIERTLDSAGVYTNEAITVVYGSGQNSSGTHRQFSLMLSPSISYGSTYGVLMVLGISSGASIGTGRSTDAFGTNIPISPVFPSYGKFGNPMTACGRVCPGDVVEGVTFTTTMYSSTITCLTSKASTFAANFGQDNGSNTSALWMRFD